MDEEGGDEKAFCCIYATARDYARIGSLLLHEGRVGSEQVVPKWFYDEMIKPANLGTEYDMPNYQYGLHIWTYFGNANPVYYCRGVNGQYIITVPEEDLMIVRLGSSRKAKFVIPDHLKDDKAYVEQNKYEVGHSLGLFQYIKLGKLLKSQTEL